MRNIEPNVLIRADAGSDVGYGHIVRCLSLAESLIRHGAAVTVATRSPSEDIIVRVREVGATLRDIGPAHEPQASAQNVLSAALQRQDAQDSIGTDDTQWDAVVVDHYRLDAEWEGIVRSHARKLVVVDDLANRSHVADVLVDHNWYGSDTGERYAELVAPATVQLLGPGYCLLSPVYATMRQTRADVNRPPRRVLINFGGTDATGQTLLAANAALESTNLLIDIVIGSRTLLSEALIGLSHSEPRVTLHVAVPHMADLLSRADLVVGASGTGTWERLCMKLPSIVTTVSESQSGVTRALARAGVCTWLGVASEVRPADYADALHRAVTEGLSVPPPVVDGFGAARVALAVLGKSADGVAARTAVESDDASFVSVSASNDPAAGPAQWHSYGEEFASLLRSGERVDILHIDGTPIGVEIRLKSGEVHCLLDTCLEEGEGQ